MKKHKIKKLITLSLTFTLIMGSNVFASEIDDTVASDVEMSEIKDHILKQDMLIKSEKAEALAQEIYQEKYVGFLMDDFNEDDDAIIDIAYDNMLAKENYIVALISEQSGEPTTMNAWEQNLKYLQLHYDEIIALENVNMLYVDAYIEDYEIVKAAQDLPVTRVNANVRASYSSSDAVTYAEKYYSSYNSSYPDWTTEGGDCANFISQCLYAGGKSMKGTPGTSSAADSWSNWFSKGSSLNTKNVSSTWRGANAFKSYWQSNASGYSTFQSVGTESYNYGFKGDAVSLLNSNGSAYHTMIIVGYDPANKDFILAAHTGNTKTAKLSNYAPAGGFVIYDM